jgi:hypothetical protein
MQTAVNMTLPFGVNIADKFGPPEYSVDLSFRGSEQRPEIKEFMNVMKQIDEKMIEEGVKNSMSWFKDDDMPKEVMKKLYTPSVKYSKDKDGKVLDYPPNLKLKLRKVNNEFETKFYDVNGNPFKGVSVEDMLVKGSQITAIIECAGVWFAGGKYGLTWRAKQIAIHKMPEKIADFAFKGLGSLAASKVDDDEDDAASQASNNEIDDEETFSKPAPTKPSVVAAVMPKESTPPPKTVEDEDGDDIEPVSAPKKTIVKKKIIAKK